MSVVFQGIDGLFEIATDHHTAVRKMMATYLGSKGSVSQVSLWIAFEECRQVDACSIQGSLTLGRH